MTPLMAGAALVLSSPEQLAGEGFAELIATQNVTRLHLPTIVGHASRQNAERRQTLDIRQARIFRTPGVHAHSLAFGIGVGLGLCATCKGESGAMPSVRNELPITLENTGAATSPP